MKILKFIIATLVMALSCTSCLESNLEELSTYEGNDIDAVTHGIAIKAATLSMQVESSRLSRGS